MGNRRVTDKYYFSVEGYTEKWYLDWLEKQINADARATHHVSFNTKVEKNPFKHAKSIVNLGPVNVCHVFDFEDNDEVHTTQFRNTLSSMKRAGSSGRSIKYVSGYSNYTFELWILLHKQDARRSLAHRRDYLQPINSAFNEHFEDLHAYKRENNFKRVLSKMSLDDVVRAIERAKTIDRINRENRLHFREHCGYTYCLDNPATDLWMTIEKILSTAGIIQR